MAGEGNNNVHRGPGKNKRVRAALVRYADAHPDKLDELAVKWFRQALGGDVSAMTAIRDTMDGRPAQTIVGDDEANPINVRHAIEMHIVDPKG